MSMKIVNPNALPTKNASINFLWLPEMDGHNQRLRSCSFQLDRYLVKILDTYFLNIF